MLFSRLILAAVAVTAVSAVPVPCESEDHAASKTLNVKPSSSNIAIAEPTTKAATTHAVSATKSKGKSTAKGKSSAKATTAKSTSTKATSAKSTAANSTSAKATSAKATSAKSTAAAQTTAAAPPPANTAAALPPPQNTATDSGVAGVIEGCVNPDGVTECFQILNVLGSCFSIPRPLANNVAFFLPPPAVKGVPNTCTLFTDEDCKNGGEVAAGQIKVIGQNSFICNATATATTTTAETTTTTTTAAANTALSLPSPKNTNKDSGVAGVIEGCVNPDGVTECFQILNVLGSCFSIPRPLANNVAFFLPPPAVAGVASTCTLFDDEDCKNNAEVVLGQAQNIQKNSFICNATTAAA